MVWLLKFEILVFKPKLRVPLQPVTLQESRSFLCKGHSPAGRVAFRASNTPARQISPAPCMRMSILLRLWQSILQHNLRCYDLILSLTHPFELCSILLCSRPNMDEDVHWLLMCESLICLTVQHCTEEGVEREKHCGACWIDHCVDSIL